MRYIIYCDESVEKGTFYSNFYGGALVAASDRELIESRLQEIKDAENIKGEVKWTKTSVAYEEKYTKFVDAFFEMVCEGKIKVRIMFTQNINQRPSIQQLESGDDYFLLYYQFLKHAFGLRYANPEKRLAISVSVMMDDVPQKKESFDNFKNYLSSLSVYPVFTRNRISICKSEISGVDSKKHNILQAVDYVLGAMQFRLNDKHKIKPEGSRFRGNRTRSKERMYKRINGHICSIYPRFNIGVSTGVTNGAKDRWEHKYRHWVFVPSDSSIDLSKGKRR